MKSNVIFFELKNFVKLKSSQNDDSHFMIVNKNQMWNAFFSPKNENYKKNRKFEITMIDKQLTFSKILKQNCIMRENNSTNFNKFDYNAKKLMFFRLNFEILSFFFYNSKHNRNSLTFVWSTCTSIFSNRIFAFKPRQSTLTTSSLNNHNYKSKSSNVEFEFGLKLTNQTSRIFDLSKMLLNSMINLNNIFKNLSIVISTFWSIVALIIFFIFSNTANVVFENEKCC